MFDKIEPTYNKTKEKNDPKNPNPNPTTNSHPIIKQLHPKARYQRAYSND